MKNYFKKFKNILLVGIVFLASLFLNGCGGSTFNEGASEKGGMARANVTINWKKVDRAIARLHKNKTIPPNVDKIEITAQSKKVVITKSANRPTGDNNITIIIYDIPAGNVKFTARAKRGGTIQALTYTIETLEVGSPRDVELNFNITMPVEKNPPSSRDAQADAYSNNQDTVTIVATLYAGDEEDGSGRHPMGAGEEVYFEKVNDSLAGATLIDGVTRYTVYKAVTTNAEGKATMRVKSSEAGTMRVKASYRDGIAVITEGTVELTFAELPPEGNISLNAVPSSISISDWSGGSSAITATVLNDSGQRIQGKLVDFTITSGTGTLNPASDITDSNGEAHTTLTSSTAGMVIVKGAWNDDPTKFAYTTVTFTNMTTQNITCFPLYYTYEGGNRFHMGAGAIWSAVTGAATYQLVISGPPTARRPEGTYSNTFTTAEATLDSQFGYGSSTLGFLSLDNIIDANISVWSEWYNWFNGQYGGWTGTVTARQ